MSRVRLSLEELDVRDAPESAGVGPGLLIGSSPTAASRVDVDEVIELRDELDKFLEERGRR